MTKYAVTEYQTFEALKAGIEAQDNTINIGVINVQTQNEKKYALITGREGTFIDGGSL